jgi:gliding motility-associated lipoprotein GldH
MPYYSESLAVDSSGWSSSDTLKFDLSISDSTTRFNSHIDLSHTGSYPFSNLYLFIDIAYPNSKHRIDTVECVLADNRGRWYGSGLGDIVNHRIEYLNDIAFPLSGDYEVAITHGMRSEPLEEITDLGLRLEGVSL